MTLFYVSIINKEFRFNDIYFMCQLLTKSFVSMMFIFMCQLLTKEFRINDIYFMCQLLTKSFVSMIFILCANY